MTVNGTVGRLVGDVIWVVRLVEGKLVSTSLEIKLDAVLPLPVRSAATFSGICIVMVPSESGIALKL